MTSGAIRGTDRRPDAPGHGGRIGWIGRPGGPVAREADAERREPSALGTATATRPAKQTTNDGDVLFYAWTIDGTEPTSQEDIFAVNIGTGAVRRLTDESSGTPFISDRDPSWSPDRNQIIHMRADASSMRLAVSTAAGAPVTELAVEGTHPIWLDDTAALCAVHRLGGGGFYNRADLVAVDVPGGAQTAITAANPGEYLSEPVWHPTSGLAAVLTREDPATQAHLTTGLVHIAAGAVEGVLTGGPALGTASFTRLTHGTAWDASPDWSPTGTHLAFSTLRPCATPRSDGSPLLQSEIAMMALRTPCVIDLVTDDSARFYDEGINDGSPAFSPDGTVLAWVRGHEDDWTQIVTQRVGSPTTRRVVLDGGHWFRHGLDW